MKKILITGATGNIGLEVIKHLFKSVTKNKIVAGVRNIEKAKKTLNQYPDLEFVEFDFENQNTYSQILSDFDTVFLLRPPHISDVERFILPLITKIKESGINEIVFLSVQGADKSDIIPHNKIEKLIINSGLDYIFLRPSYFMQNLTTTLLKDIQSKQEIVLPAGKAKFNWIDIENIAEIGALVLNQFDKYKNSAYDLTGDENENFYTVSNLISKALDYKIKYRKVNPFRFYFIKKKEGIPRGLIIVMILLHFLPRFQKEPTISDFFEKVTGKSPTKLVEFIDREKNLFVRS